MFYSDEKNKSSLFVLKGIIIGFYFLSFLFNNASAQQIVVNTMANDGQEIALKRDTVTIIKSFSAILVRDTAYLSWTVQYMRSNGVFILYCSSDGINFNVIGTKNVFGMPINKPIAHYFRDADYGGGTKYYRLVYISRTSGYLVSEKIKVGAENIVGVAQK